MNLDYWEEQIKATIAIVAHFAVPVTESSYQLYVPLVIGGILRGELAVAPAKVAGYLTLGQLEEVRGRRGEAEKVYQLHAACSWLLARGPPGHSAGHPRSRRLRAPTVHAKADLLHA